MAAKYSAVITVANTATGSVSLTGASGAAIKYTARLTLTAATTTTAATVYGQCALFSSTKPDASVADTTNFPLGYPLDLTVWSSGTQIDCDILQCTSTNIVVEWGLQTTIAAAGSSTAYTLEWGDSGATTMNTLGNIYLWADNFPGTTAMTSGSPYTLNGVTGTPANGSVSLVASGTTQDAAGLVVNSGLLATAATNYDASVEVMFAKAQAWTADGSRCGVRLRLNTLTSGDGYALLYHGGGTATQIPVTYLEEGQAWNGASFGGNAAASTWYGMRFKIVGTSVTVGNLRGRAWTVGAAAEEAVAYTSNATLANNITAVGVGLVAPSTNQGLESPALSPTFRAFRVRVGILDSVQPTITVAAAVTASYYPTAFLVTPRTNPIYRL